MKRILKAVDKSIERGLQRCLGGAIFVIGNGFALGEEYPYLARAAWLGIGVAAVVWVLL